MLSRSNSTAGDRLRRAKSTSSQHTASSGHQRSSTSIDPFMTRQQAEVAAIEAYNRAKQSEEFAQSAHRPVPPKLQRRRSQITGKTEGSHFEDARFGRRRSISSKGDNQTAQAVRNKQPRMSESTTDHGDEEKVITRKRSVIPPSVITRQSQPEYLSVPPVSHRLRKAQSVYADGSPTPRHASALQDQSSTLQLSSSPQTEHPDGYGGNLANLSRYSEPFDNYTRTYATQRLSTLERQADQDIVAAARDKCLQDFQQKKLRERKSIFLAPFQKRRATYVQSTGDSSHDSGLPPFNYVEDAALVPVPPPFEPVLASQIPITVIEKKSRIFSGTLKGRIKQVFQKASRAPSGMPAQQVEAKRFHYSTSEDAYHSLSEKQYDPFSTFSAGTHIAACESEPRSANSRESVGQSSDVKSRVTSWANSTVTGTCASRADTGSHMPHVSEHGQLKRSGSQSTLRKASSFFGRPVMNKLRKPSKAQLSSSEETHGLYSALQERIQPPRTTPEPSLPVIPRQVSQSRPPSAIASLPSQRFAEALLPSTNNRYSTATVRSVTPELSAYKLGICSPVAEVQSPDIAAPAEPGYDVRIAPRSSLQRRIADQAPPPSQEQLARRVEKSKNRWQSPLDELSPAAPGSTRATAYDDNPYELRSLSQRLQQPPTGDKLPHHAKIKGPEQSDRANVLSPSVYSRATDDGTPGTPRSAEPVGTVVTITGREVRSYSISPPKKTDLEPSKPAQTSGQWRRWLSDELGSFKNGLEMLTLTQPLHDAERDSAVDSAKPAVELQDTANTGRVAKPLSARLPSDESSSSAAASSRPRVVSQRSSFMNDRYPMVDGSRNSSAQSVTSRDASRMGDHTVGRSEQNSQETARASSGEIHVPRASRTRQRVITARQSIARLETADRGKSACSETAEPMMSGALPNEQQTAPTASSKVALTAERKARITARHKSNFELGAKYKTSINSESTLAGLRRGTMNEMTNNSRNHSNTAYNSIANDDRENMLEDTTIMNISAGPYAKTHQAPTITSRAHKENTPPPTSSAEANSLPALSSSEWLSASNAHKARRVCQNVQPPTAVHPAYRTRETRALSRYSPSRIQASPGAGVGREGNIGVKEGGKDGSPGQRLAGEWLERRSQEGTPAFL